MENLTEEQYRKRIDALLRFAKKGHWPVDELTAAEEELYRDVQNLYAMFRQGSITAEDGKSRKAQILNKFWSKKDEEGFRRMVSKRYSNMMIRIESAANAYAKDRTLENADKLYKALYGMLPTKEEEK